MPTDPTKGAQYRVERERGGGYTVYDPDGRRIGWAPLTLWGAKRIIRLHKRGRGVGTTAYRERA